MNLDISPTLARDWTLEDHGAHEPTGQELFQESALFNFADPRTGVGGEYRIGVHPNLGTANLYTWTQVRGRFADKRFIENAAIPDGPVNDTTLEGVSISTIDPFKKYRIMEERPGLKLDIIWETHTIPLPIVLDVRGVTVGADHYNSVGRARGHVEYNGEILEIDGDGYMDHSWGERKVHPSASRSIVAVFDPGCFFVAFAFLMDPATYVCGYVAYDGKLRALGNRSEFNFGMRDDWLTPDSCDAWLFDEDGRGFRVRGKSSGLPSGHPYSNGIVLTHSMTEYELGGRVGRGMLESYSPRGMLSSQVRGYGLDPEGQWVKHES